MEKVLELWRKALPPNHIDLVVSYDNTGNTYSKMKQDSKALSFYKQAIEAGKQRVETNRSELIVA